VVACSHSLARGVGGNRACTFAEEVEPVSEDCRCRAASRDTRTQRQAGKLGGQFRLAVGARAAFEVRQDRLGFGVEITGWNCGKVLTLAREEACDVAHIFPLQRERVIFRMTLKENETALEVARKDIDAGFLRTSEDSIALCREIAFPYRIEARMRDLDFGGEVADEPI